MAQSKTELSIELDRVIGCSYPASLANLAKHLAVADVLDIRALVSDRAPCAISKLASIVIEALPLWHHTIDVLRALSECPVFSETLLTQSPRLLNDLLSVANASQNGFEEYAQLCTTLLSRPLPHTVPLPASAHAFFISVFKQAKTSDIPESDALKSLYYMLKGACKGLLNLLPVATRDTFEENLGSMIKKLHEAEYSILSLWCFGLTIIAEHPDALDSGVRVSTSALQWKAKAGSRVFERDIQKTLKILVLRVTWVMKEGVGFSDTEILEGIRIASRALRLVEQWKRDEWAAQAANSLTKLSSKLRCEDINPAIQLEALCFYALSAGSRGLPSDFIARYANAITRVMAVIDTDCFAECLSASLSLFAPHMQEYQASQILIAILQSNVSPVSALRMANARVLCDEMDAVVLGCPHFRNLLVVATSSKDVQEAIDNFLRVDVGFGDAKAQSCSTYTAMTHRELVSATISTMLSTTFLSKGSESAVPHAFGHALLKKRRLLPVASNRCTHTINSGSLPSLSLFQQECTPLSGNHLQDWKERLHSELENQDKYQRDAIVRNVARICHNLEIRCETVEAPLFQEREKSAQLSKQMMSLREEIKALKVRRWEDSEHCAALETEKDALESEKERVEEQKKRLEIDCERLQENFEIVTIEAEKDLHEAREAFSAKELQFQSVVLGHEENTRTLGNSLEGAKQTINAISDRLNEEKGKGRDLADAYKDLQDRLDATRHELASEQTVRARQKTELSRLEHENSDLQKQLQDTESNLTTTTERLSELQVQYHESTRSSNEALQKLEEQHENGLKIATLKAEEEHERINGELQDAVRNGRELQRSCLDAQNDRDQLRSVVHKLEAEAQESAEAALEKDHEILVLKSQVALLKSQVADWQTMRQTMLATLQPPPDAALAPRRIHEAADPHPAHSHRRRRSVAQVQSIQAPIGTQTISSTTMENVADASFTSSDSPSPNGSTPKRPKPRPQASFKAPAMRSNHGNKSSKSATKKSSSAKRPALQPVSPN